jgi:two-component system sensor histidine kinase ChiS
LKLKLKSTEIPAVARESRVPTIDTPRVAIVDDEPGNVAALVSLLQPDYRVSAYTDPRVALQQLEANPVDAVLTDQRMPGMLGTELLVKLKARGQTPVSVIVTGYTDVNDLVLCINEGLIHRYVLKPWSPETIRDALRTGVSAARHASALDRLAPRQALDRLFPEGLDRLAPGRTRTLACAVMSADLRGFSAVAETLDAADAYSLLSQYFETVMPLIASHGGFVDQFVGDGVLGIFADANTSASQALACARAIDRAVRSFSPTIGAAPVRPGEWRVGIGVASGAVTLGTVAAPDRVEVTLLGDTVSVAARLEEACKFLGATALVQSTLLDAETSDVRALGMVPLRGRAAPVAVHELIDRSRANLAPAAALVDVVAAQQAGDLPRALAALTGLVGEHPEDRVLRGLLGLWRARTDVHDA